MVNGNHLVLRQIIQTKFDTKFGIAHEIVLVVGGQVILDEVEIEVERILEHIRIARLRICKFFEIADEDELVIIRRIAIDIDTQIEVALLRCIS